MSLRKDLQYLHDICRCITVKGGMSTEACSEKNCVRCRLKPLIASLPEDVVEPDPLLCPRCLSGRDTDGDGNCPVCAHLSKEEADKLAAQHTGWYTNLHKAVPNPDVDRRAIWPWWCDICKTEFSTEEEAARCKHGRP